MKWTDLCCFSQPLQNGIETKHVIPGTTAESSSLPLELAHQIFTARWYILTCLESVLFNSRDLPFYFSSLIDLAWQSKVDLYLANAFIQSDTDSQCGAQETNLGRPLLIRAPPHRNNHRLTKLTGVGDLQKTIMSNPEFAHLMWSTNWRSALRCCYATQETEQTSWLQGLKQHYLAFFHYLRCPQVSDNSLLVHLQFI